MATRGVLILGTALVGASLVGSGLALLAMVFSPDHYRLALERSQLVGFGWLALLVLFMGIQARLTRKPKTFVVAEEQVQKKG